MRARLLPAGIPFLLFLTSCGLPHFAEKPGQVPNANLAGIATSNKVKAPTVADIINHIQCEVLTEAKKDDYAYLRDHRYVGAANLTIEVTYSEGIDPSLSFIFPYKLPMTNFALSVSGQFSGIQHRTYNVLFPVFLEKLGDSPFPCGDKGEGSYEIKDYGLHGDLELDKTLAMGLISVGAMLPAESTTAVPAKTLSDPTTAYASFGSTMDFTVTWGANGGPGYTIQHLHGPQPTGGTSGLLNYSQLFKDTLVISFAPPKLAAAPAGQSGQVVTTTPAAPLPPPPSPPEKTAKSLYELNIPDFTGKSQDDRDKLEREFRSKAYLASLIEHQKTTAAATTTTTVAPAPSLDAYTNAQQNNTQMILQSILPR